MGGENFALCRGVLEIQDKTADHQSEVASGLNESGFGRAVRSSASWWRGSGNLNTVSSRGVVNPTP